MQHTTLACAVLLASLSCAAAPNPRIPGDPAPWQPSAPPQPAATAGGAAKDANASAVPAGPASTPAAPGTSPVAASAAPANPTSGLAIAMVAGKPVDAADLIAQWVHHKSNDALQELDHLVLTRLVGAEAQRLGVVVAKEAAEASYAAAIAAMEKEIEKRRPGIKIDAWIDQVLGLDPYVYRERLREDALDQLVAERVTRAWVLTTEHAELRLIVVKSEAELKGVQEALSKGEDFAAVARRFSSDPSAKDGGTVPPVMRADTPMGRLAFTTPIGAVSDPLYNQGAWLIAKVDARPKPIDGLWPQIGAAVEASLTQKKIEELEFSQWRSAMLQRYQVDITPFLRLAGQPVR